MQGLSVNPYGGPSTIFLTACIPDRILQGTLADNGIGINEVDQTRIFSMHQRVEGNNSEEGTGVGLALIAKLVDGNHGKIEVESKVEAGSTFKIYLK